MLDNLNISDFESILERIIGSDNSNGNIGGKGAGLFIAKQILRHAAADEPLLLDIKTPRTWYLATDQMVDFLHYNNLEEFNSYKYNSLLHLPITYDSVVSKIKNAKLPPHTVKMLHVVLEEMGDVPLIVRSSSLLEDKPGRVFSGKYKSLFLPNQGTRAERLEALIDAILEVYSSMYNPDAIEYRREKELLNYAEQMGILIQEVVGSRVGDYYMLAFSGVAFSHNLLRWSARIEREDGLVKMVMGLGTRAVDRVKDDYPLLFSPVEIEFAKKKQAYLPEPSFGTQFFQDLVESGIVYLPLFSDDKGIIFKEGFFRNSKNILGVFLPPFARLSNVIKVIDIPADYSGQSLSIHMNSDLEQAVAFLTDPESASGADLEKSDAQAPLWMDNERQNHWQWRRFMALQIADSLDMEAFGVKEIYLFGSTNTGEAGMGSDIDLLLHIKEQNSYQQSALENWLDGWNRALAKVNYLQTGYKIDKLLDIHMVTDKDINEGNSFAIKIKSPVDPATPLRICSPQDTEIP